MKLFFIIVALAITSLTAAQEVALRITFDSPLTDLPEDMNPRDQSCTPEENEIIQLGLQKANGAQRKLRTGRGLQNPWWCYWACRGWQTGYCWLAYPECTSFRRGLTEAEGPVAIPEGAKQPQIVGERSLKSLQDQCNQKKQDTKAVFKEIVQKEGGISKECKHVFKNNVNAVCFLPV